MTLPALITNIHNKGYAERLIKLYSALGQANISISQDIGEDPENWTFSHYANTNGNEDNLNILSLYQKYLKALKICGRFECILANEKYSYLNGTPDPKPFYSGYQIYHSSYMIKLSDGSTVAVLFAQNDGGGMFWPLYSLGYKILYIIDVNGEQKPNKLGRDIFFLALDGKTGKIIPYNMEDMSDCTTSGKGESCAAKIISEGKMNY